MKTRQSCTRTAKQKLALGSVLLLLLMNAAPAFAQYRPSGSSRPRSPTTTTGRRGGCSDSQTALTVLAPQNYVGQTASSHPTFAWYVPDEQPVMMEFHLYQYTASDRELIHKVEMQSQPGMMSLMLPTDHPGLQVGQQYLWQAVLLCNPNRPSGAIVAKAELTVLGLPSELEAALAQTDNPLQRADLYAEAGFWYDAFAEALQGSGTSAEVTQVSLLEDLSRSETTNGVQHLQLQQVIANFQSR